MTQSFTTQSSVEEQNENTGDMNGTIILSKGVVISEGIFLNSVLSFRKFNKIADSICQPKVTRTKGVRSMILSFQLSNLNYWN